MVSGSTASTRVGDRTMFSDSQPEPSHHTTPDASLTRCLLHSRHMLGSLLSCACVDLDEAEPEEDHPGWYQLAQAHTATAGCSTGRLQPLTYHGRAWPLGVGRCPARAARNPLATRQPECNQTPQSTAAQSLLQLVGNPLEGGLDMVLYLLLLIGVNLGSKALHKLRWAG